jgi:hypothetical protein
MKPAPSVTPLELPAVTRPSFRNAGLSRASFSRVASARGNSSVSNVRVPRPSGTSIGTIWRARNPDAMAARARAWLIAPHSSMASRVYWKSSARFSAVSPM